MLYEHFAARSRHPVALFLVILFDLTVRLCRTVRPHLLAVAFCGIPLGLLAVTPTAFSQSCGIDRTGKACGAGTGNPINAMSGNKYQEEIDLPALPGVLGLEIVRHYNSDLSKPADAPGIIGRGWRLSYEIDLFINDARIDIRDADGTVHTFICDALDRQRCDSTDRLRGTVRRLGQSNRAQSRVTDAAQSSSNDYLWTWNDGRVLRFNQHGKLVQIEVPSGEFVTLQYDARQLLMSITDPQGRQLQLHYPDRASTSNETYRGVDWIDSPVGRFGFSYGSQLPKSATLFSGYLLANLVRVDIPTLLQTSISAPIGEGEKHRAANQADGAQIAATTPDKRSRVYHYEDALRPTFLTGISNGGIGSTGKTTVQRHSTFAYNADGKAILSTHPDDVNKVSVDYRSASESIVINSLGQPTVYKYAIINRQYRLLEVVGAGCYLCIEPNIRFGYDEHGRQTSVTSLTPRGQPLYTMQSELDYYGRTLKVSRIDYRNGKPLPAQLQMRYEYGPERGREPIPSGIFYPSVVAGKQRVKRIKVNAAGQPIAVTESGWVPADVEGSALSTGSHTAGMAKPAEPVPIERTTTYRYTIINGRSLLMQIDGPLPNGPGNSSADSDITTYKYDARGNFIVESVAPGNRTTRTRHADATGMIIGIDKSDGVHPPQRMQISHNARGQPVKMTHEIISDAALLESLPLAEKLMARLRQWFGGVFNLRLIPASDTPVSAPSDASASAAAIKLTTRIDYTLLGDPLRVTRADGTSIEAIYDAANRLVGTRDQFGNASTQQLDTEHQLLASLTQSTSSSTPLDIVTRYRYDALRRVTDVVDPSLGSTHYDYDISTGLLAQSVDVQKRKTTYRHDQLGRLVAIAQNTQRPYPAITKASYFADSDEVESITAANGARTYNAMDDFGRTLRIDSPDGGSKQARYDAADRLIETRDANGNITRTSYDAASRPTTRLRTGQDSTGRADTLRTDYVYEGDRLMSVTGRNQRDDYRYDANGRVTEKSVTLIPTSLASTKAPANQNTHSIAPLRFITRYHYDPFDRIDRTTLASGETVQIGNGPAGQPTSMHLISADGHLIRPLITDMASHPFAGLVQFIHGNGLTTRFQYDKSSGQMASLTISPLALPIAQNNAAAFEFFPAAHAATTNSPIDLLDANKAEPVVAPRYAQRLQYDQAGQIIGITRTDGDAKKITERYDYDDQGHLNQAITDTENTTWTYDNIGNRQTIDANGIRTEKSKLTYQPGSNRLTEVDQGNRKTRYEYDRAGNPIRIGADANTYGVDGRLQQVKRAGKVIAQYAYNDGGERIAKTVTDRYGGEETTYFLYQQNKLDTEINSSGEITAHYIYIGHIPVIKLAYASSGSKKIDAKRDVNFVDKQIKKWFRNGASQSSSEIYAIHADHLGTPRSMTNYAKKEVWRANYDAFGASRILLNEIELNLRFPGQYFDEETGMHYNYFRDYDPSLGRYLQSDPIGLGGGINTYLYALGNPASLIDTLGLELTSVTLPGIGLTFLDDKFISTVEAFINDARNAGITIIVTEAFRTTEYQRGLSKNSNAITPAGAGTILHEAGYAIDISWRRIPTSMKERLIQIADQVGLSWGGRFKKIDKVHFFVNPIIERGRAIKDAQARYKCLKASNK